MAPFGNLADEAELGEFSVPKSSQAKVVRAFVPAVNSIDKQHCILRVQACSMRCATLSSPAMPIQQANTGTETQAWWLVEAPVADAKQKLLGIRFEMLYRIDEEVKGWSAHDAIEQHAYSQVSMEALGKYLNHDHGPGPNKTFIDRILGDGHTSPAAVAGEPNVFVSYSSNTSWASFFGSVKKSISRLMRSGGPDIAYLWIQHLCVPHGAGSSSSSEWLSASLPELVRSVNSFTLVVGSTGAVLALRDLACLWELFLCISCGSNLDVVFEDTDETLLNRYPFVVDSVCSAVKFADATTDDKTQLLRIQAAFDSCGCSWHEVELIICHAVRSSVPLLILCMCRAPACCCTLLTEL